MNKVDKPIKDDSGPATDALNILSAATFGISPDFLKENDKLMDNTLKVLSDKLSPRLQNTNKSNGNVSNVAEYIKVLSSTMNQEERISVLSDIKSADRYVSPSGSHVISDDTQVIDRLSDSTVVDELLGTVRNHFALMPEYAKVCEIIPELGKCVEIIVKDIINRDEFSHSFITNFYKDSSDSSAENSIKVNVENKIKSLLDEYDFEGKVRKWIKDAEIMGVKPFSILPQDDVIHMLNTEISKRVGSGVAIESLKVEDIVSEESFLVKSPLTPIYDSYTKLSLGMISEESTDYKYIKESVDHSVDKFVDSILSEDILDDWSEVCLEELDEIFKSEKFNHGDSPESYEKFCTSAESFKQEVKDPKNILKKNNILKNQLKDLVVSLDKSIEVVDTLKAPLYQASKKLKNNSYGNSQVDVDKGIIEDFYRVDDSKTTSDSRSGKRTFNLDGFEIDITDSPIDIKSYAKAIKNRRAILTEYEPEHVIPITSGGTHIGYYVVEYARTSGDNFLLLKKDRGSFLDIIRRLGVGEDKSLVANTGTTAVDSNNPFSSGVFSPSTIMAPIMSGGNGPMSANGTRLGNNGQSDRKTELIKAIMIKTISKRLGDETLVDNGTFQSSLMNLIRDDLMFRNRIRFSFIPESHMVYMSRELDSSGFPLSVLDGTLFNCYTYISSLISSLMMKVMKSSDTEVMEVNVGKSKELGLTIGAISQNASTRNVSAKSLFGGTDNIVRSVGNFKRIIIPVVNGEKLYDVTQVERVNDVDIDDDFTERNLKSIVMKIGVPPTSLDMLSQDEYVASQTQHRIDYRNLIADRGVNYSKFVTKAIKLLVHYSDISIPSLKILNEGQAGTSNNKNSEIEIDISKIDFNFSLPKNLTVNKVAEELGSVLALIEDIIKVYYGETEKESPEWANLMVVTKKKLMKELSSSTDWSSIDEIIRAARREAPAAYADLSKYDTPPVNDEESEGGGNMDSGSDSEY